MKKTTLLLFLLLSIEALAQPGTLDFTFNPSDLGFSAGANNAVSASVVQPDGKIIIGGSFTSYNGVTSNRITRLNSDGSLDIAFSVGIGPNNVVTAIALQPDGKIIIGGNFSSFNGSVKNRIIRLNSDGSTDAGFTIGTGANNLISTIALQSDGKILIGGNFTTYNGTARSRVARLNSNGSLDAGFIVGTGANALVSALKVQADGKIIMGGSFVTYNSVTANRLARLNTDGSLDVGFITGTGTDNYILAIAIQPDAKIIIGGSFLNYNGQGINRVARLNSDGTLDAGFNVGTAANNIVRAVALQADDKVFVGGDFTNFNGTAKNRIVRLNTDGSLDAGHSIGTGAAGSVSLLTLQLDGKLFIGGSFTTYNAVTRNRIARLNTDGSLDFTFGSDTGANNTVRAILTQPDGKILIAGVFTLFNGTTRNGIARLNTDGSLDASFNPGTGINSASTIFTMVRQTDGKIIIGGSFTSYNGNSANRIARLNSDGSFDNSFTISTGFNNTVNSIVLQNDGKIIVGGLFTNYNGTTRNRIIRLNANGTLDAGFIIGTGANNTVQVITLQSDNKILIGGNFTSYMGVSIPRLARLNADGSPDAGFTIGTGPNNVVNAIALQSDGKIMIGGTFTLFNGTTANRITRLNANGSLDTGFNVSGTGANNIVWSIALQPDGKMIVGGQFTTYNGTARNYIVSLNTDGTINTNFIQGTGANNAIYVLMLQSDYKVLITGAFTGYNGVGKNRIARLNEDPTLSNEAFELKNLMYYPNPTSSIITFSNNIAIDSIALFAMNGQHVLSVAPHATLYQLDISMLSAGMYLVQVSAERKKSCIKVIKQ
nr:T9SS type A sorting domain-containing protein [uncultured Flavobacterium sp.]